MKTVRQGLTTLLLALLVTLCGCRDEASAPTTGPAEAAAPEFYVPDPEKYFADIHQPEYPGLKTVTVTVGASAGLCPETVRGLRTVNYPQSTGHRAIDDQIAAFIQPHLAGTLKDSWADIIGADQERCDSFDDSLGYFSELLFFISRSSPRYFSIMFYRYENTKARERVSPPGHSENYRGRGGAFPLWRDGQPLWQYTIFNFDYQTGRRLDKTEILAGPDRIPAGVNGDEDAWAMLAEGDVILTIDGLTVVCGPGRCRSGSGHRNIAKEKLVELGVSPQFWDWPEAAAER